MLEEGVACLPLYTKDNKKFGSPIKCYALCLGYDDGKDSNFPLAALAPVLPLQHIISAIVLTVEHISPVDAVIINMPAVKLGKSF